MIIFIYKKVHISMCGLTQLKLIDINKVMYQN